MKPLNAKHVTTFVAGLSLAALCFALQARSSEPEAIPSSVCMDCHEDAPAALVGTAHDPLGVKVVACADCHKGPRTTMHIDDEDIRPIVPAKLPADSMTMICAACHKNPHALNLYERDPHGDADLSCAACHKIHNNNEYASLLKGPENTVCLDCHASVRSDFALPTHHPVTEEGVVACRDCHIEIAQSPRQRSAGGPGETCVQCHGRMQGPFPYEHDPAVTYSVNDGGCLNCHNAHGSEFPMLLKQTYGQPHFSLCSQCHVVPKHLNNQKHGTMWAGVACNECHTDIHGSYTSPHLLDPSLEVQGCFKAGCHQ